MDLGVLANKKDLTREDLAQLEVAIVHYWFVTWRGGEKVVEAILRLFPKADIYTLFYDPATCGSYLKGHQVYSSVLDTPILRKHYQKIFPLYPLGIKSLKLRKKYDLIISSESGPAKGIHIPKPTPHLCYIHSPMRYCWGYTQSYLDSLPRWSRGLAAHLFEGLRKWDETTIHNVNKYVANSNNVADRVKRFFNRSAEVSYPPIALEIFSDQSLAKREKSSKDYYLSFGAITPYKNVQLLVERFNQTGERLIVIGEGSEKIKLEEIAKSNITFTGGLPYDKIQDYILGARALLFPGEEDFGMIPLEVMAHGVPVIAYGKGGALETVVENDTVAESSGVFFEENSVSSLNEAIVKFEKIEKNFNSQWIQNHARRFGEDLFLKDFSGKVIDLMNSNS